MAGSYILGFTLTPKMICQRQLQLYTNTSVLNAVY